MTSLCILLSLCYYYEFEGKSDETYGPIPRDAMLTPTGNPLDVLDTRMKASPEPYPLWWVYENNLQLQASQPPSEPPHSPPSPPNPYSLFKTERDYHNFFF